MKYIAIIGGGISGLIIASEHKRNGNKVKLFESNNRIGGVVQSKKINGFLLDLGPNTLNVRLKKTKNILQDHNAWDTSLDANQLANKRMIIRDGRIIYLPHGFLSFLKSPFLSTIGKLRLFLEPFIPRARNPDTESVASFISRRLGKEVLNYAGNPFLSGIYAANPDSLNLKQAFPTLWNIEKQYRSLFLGFRKLAKKKDNPNLKKTRLISYAGGMEELVQKIYLSLKKEVFLSHSVQRVSFEKNRWKISYKNQKEEILDEEFDQIISTIPSHRINSIEWKNIQGKMEIETLASAIHYPLTLVFLGYKKESISHPLNGFGFLVPQVEDFNILGTLFSSTLFPGRAPDGQVLLTTFVGGERNPSFAQLDKESIISLVKNDLSQLLGIKDEPVFSEIKNWSKAIPLPDNHMEKRKGAAQKLSELNPGLSFSGSYLNGVSLPSCLDTQPF